MMSMIHLVFRVSEWGRIIFVDRSKAEVYEDKLKVKGVGQNLDTLSQAKKLKTFCPRFWKFWQ